MPWNSGKRPRSTRSWRHSLPCAAKRWPAAGTPSPPRGRSATPSSSRTGRARRCSPSARRPVYVAWRTSDDYFELGRQHLPAHSPSRLGSENVNVEPTPSWLFTQIRPPWSSTNFRHRVSPRPVPSIFFAAVGAGYRWEHRFAAPHEICGRGNERKPRGAHRILRDRRPAAQFRGNATQGEVVVADRWRVRGRTEGRASSRLAWRSHGELWRRPTNSPLFPTGVVREVLMGK